ncbi:hypothetical protein RGQ15_07355 [Paracoccus sp. MBLB3053]|uniref:DUF2946 domain-containing protein n=1 Tax=Paracoccus aurantius TaxID=3073814 RepID=A0ABU2HQS0_9RHOB|nr:hypothetical protein [Paracoccus sp. MBLB3053]MDS9467388.1 hypothetical protein [Paracoccus sp. MBLB3053]
MTRGVRQAKGKVTGRLIRSRQWLFVALFLPFVVFATIPPGGMLVPDLRGKVTVILCGSSLPVEMVIGPDGALQPVAELAPAGQQDHEVKHPICGWVAHGQPVLASGDAAPPAPIARTQEADPAEDARVVIPPQAARHFLARAPPDLV